MHWDFVERNHFNSLTIFFFPIDFRKCCSFPENNRYHHLLTHSYLLRPKSNNNAFSI